MITVRVSRLGASLLLILTLLASVAWAPTATAGPATCGRAHCYANGGGINTTTSRKEVENSPTRPGDDGSPAPVGYKGPTFEYGTTTACSLSAPDGPGAQSLCTRALTACTDPARGLGPLTRIWRRTLQAGKPPSGWTLLGVTCWADAVPGGTPTPTLTMADILQAFHTTPWSKPQITTQPVGNTTLVGLPVFYQVTWTPSGYQPGETDRLTLLGYTVDIRPRLDHFTYLFGDGDTFGPTPETGGIYPTGTITHPYLTPGT